MKVSVRVSRGGGNRARRGTAGDEGSALDVTMCGRVPIVYRPVPALTQSCAALVPH